MTSDSAVGTTVSTGNRVLRNTYWLLGITLMFSALVAGFAAQMNMPALPWYLTLAGFFGLSYLTSRFENSGAGILCVFALTGFMGYTIGPLLNHYLSMAQGGQIVMTAFGGTAISFLSMSALALFTKRDFSFMGKFLFVGLIVAFVAGLAAFFFEMTALSLAVSAMFVLLSSGVILWQTSQIVNGGETNYIRATVTLFVSIYNIFVSLLQLMGFASSD
jgi:modulator of FtsH protease